MHQRNLEHYPWNPFCGCGLSFARFLKGPLEAGVDADELSHCTPSDVVLQDFVQFVQGLGCDIRV
jgi:hypothetical protein